MSSVSASQNLVESSKRAAARAAVDRHVNSSTKVLGVGSGSTIVYGFERVVELYKEGLLNKDLVCIPTSFQSKILITKAGLRCADLDEFPNVDITIDGADEVDSQLNCIKGGGAAHLREKAVAMVSKKLILVADYRKNSEYLGTQWTSGVPVEVIPFTYQTVIQGIKSLKPDSNPLSDFGVSGLGKMFDLSTPEVNLRIAVRKAGPVVTDNGNFVIDAHFGKILNPALLEIALKKMTGVVEVGIFSNVAQEAWFGNEDGTVSVRTTDLQNNSD
ncbi:hypothetical protein BB559_006042 [Furculomyces boomerangus]|uniref:Ribose-5-phosphate isomerase n=2 Tax=Harpellales TaxID=61421 RepID=A0A2T9Y566_9FUNG|nr:hypothetical protein BB559_006042 [Furculomyces boomerangus]PWA02236.1 hypothetical protein BB558_001634 [Smittium angustum]